MSVFRVSEVEAYRQWLLDEDAALEDILSRLSGGFPSTPAMLAGTAFHKALEHALEGDVEVLEADGYQFGFELDVAIALPSVREIRASKAWMVDDKPIIISGQLDGIAGLRIEDHKTTARYDPERYMTGYQWRLYLSIFEASTFRWNIFEIKEDGHPLDWLVTHFHVLEQHRYPAMESDCTALVEGFARFVRQHLPERC